MAVRLVAARMLSSRPRCLNWARSIVSATKTPALNASQNQMLVVTARDFHAARRTAIANCARLIRLMAYLLSGDIVSPAKNGRGTTKARRIGKAHLQSRRATGKTKAGHILSAQKLGIRSRTRMEPTPESDRNRFCQQEVPSHAGGVCGGKSHAAGAGAFSGTQGQRSGVSQKFGQGKSDRAGAE